MSKGPSIRYIRKIFRKTNISNLLIRTCTCAYQGVRNVSFSVNFAYVLNGWPLNEVALFKIFQVIAQFVPNRWPHKWNALITKAICDLASYIILEETNGLFTHNDEAHFQYLKTFVAKRCYTLLFLLLGLFL